jgi:hypothetical protein
MDILPSLRTGSLTVALAPHSARETMAALIADLALRGSVTVLDAGNRFMAYRIAQLIRRKSLEVEQISKRIILRRAFTCYQVVSLLEGTHAFSHPHIILDLLQTFHDDQVSVPESRRLLNICLKEIDRLRYVAPIAISLSPAPSNGKPFLVDDLCEQADEVFTPINSLKTEEEQLILF